MVDWKKIDIKQETKNMEEFIEICPECKKDKEIFCPRNVDGQCLECGIKLCAAHLMIHFKKVHCMALDLEHCSNKKEERGVKRDR
jgi:hypothetical protein